MLLSRSIDRAAWTANWPRCLLLLELATRYTESGRAAGCAKLNGRLEEWRRRMDDAPYPVHVLLSELCYVCWLLGRGDLATARQHLAKAQKKAQDIGHWLRRWRRAEVCRKASSPPVWAVIATLSLSLAVGLLFGLLPARRAARLDPVAALAGK
jgi:hypothetical protein